MGETVMFGKKQKQQDSPSNAKAVARPAYTQAWGAYAAAARFRGWLCLILGLICILSTGALFTSVAMYRPIVVGITAEQRPTLMDTSLYEVSREVYAKDFIDALFGYNALNVDEKAEKAYAMMTNLMSKAWADKMGTEWTRLVKAQDVMQTVSVISFAISEQSSSGFVCTVNVRLTRTTRRTNEIANKAGEIVLTVRSGTPNRRNPWGLFVDAIMDNTTEAR